MQTRGVKGENVGFWGQFPRSRPPNPHSLTSLSALLSIHKEKVPLLINGGYRHLDQPKFIKDSLSFEPHSSPIFNYPLRSTLATSNVAHGPRALVSLVYLSELQSLSPTPEPIASGCSCLHPGGLLCPFKSEITCGLVATWLTEKT